MPRDENMGLVVRIKVADAGKPPKNGEASVKTDKQDVAPEIALRAGSMQA